MIPVRLIPRRDVSGPQDTAGKESNEGEKLVDEKKRVLPN